MRRIIVSVLIIGQLVFAGTTTAAESGSVPAQVTMDSPCITVDPGILDYGVLRFQATPPQQTKGFTLCNSTGFAYVYGSVGNATSTGGASWTPITSSVICLPTGVPDQYSLAAAISPNADPPTSASTYLTSTPAMIWNAPPGPLTLYAGLETPCEGSSGAGETMTFTIELTTSFS